MISVSNVAIPLDAGLPENQDLLAKCIARALGIEVARIASVRIAKRSVDARKKDNVRFVVTADVALDPPGLEADVVGRDHRGVNVRPAKPYEPLSIPACTAPEARPIVVGAGPAGLFAALYLARAGLCPLVIERGASVEERAQDVERFFATGVLDPDSNIQFGEGGAGTFSDGKLTTNVKNPLTAHVLHWFVDAGAPEEILWQAHPHLGSDNLPGIVAAMRAEIIERGGQVRFRTRLESLEFDACGKLCAAVVEREGVKTREPVRELILACGHSARDTFEMVRDAGLAMERKPFSVGVRIEHPQKLINRSQWGKAAAHPALGAAEYKLAVHLPGGRSVYTFCMCPGGEVVASASEEGGIVTNGMSEFARSGANANAALLVSVEPADYPGDDVLGGVELQRSIERAAYRVSQEAGGAPYQAPAQTVGSFLAEMDASLDSPADDGRGRAHRTKPDKRGRRAGSDRHLAASAPHPVSVAHAAVRPTYERGIVEASIALVFPPYVAQSLAQALPLLDRKLKGFADPAALMTAPETRSSSPVRIVRDATLQAAFDVAADGDAHGNGQKPDPCAGTGVYPCGEGPGYAGGIMSAAVDGLRVAQELTRRFAL